MEISVIIPVHNGERTIKKCLEAVYKSDYKDFEVIVVDDASTDNTPEILTEFPCRVLTLKENKGPAAARDIGVKKAKGGVILFIDADVVINKSTLKRIIKEFKELPKISAVQGTYDHQAYLPNLSTLYKQYHHHLKFQKADKYLNSTSTFCLAVKRKAFESIQGFDEQFPPQSAAEDVDLGLRLRRKGHTIYLDRAIKVTHLKKYTLKNLLKADFIGVSSNIKLMLRSKNFKKYPVSKNKKRKRINTIVSILLSPAIFTLPIIFFCKPRLTPYLILAYVLFFFGMNYKLLNLIRKERGLLTSLGCLPILYLDMLTSFFAILYALVDYKIIGNAY